MIFFIILRKNSYNKSEYNLLVYKNTICISCIYFHTLINIYRIKEYTKQLIYHCTLADVKCDNSEKIEKNIVTINYLNKKFNYYLCRVSMFKRIHIIILYISKGFSCRQICIRRKWKAGIWKIEKNEDAFFIFSTWYKR